METAIIELDHRTDQATRQMLQKVVDKKKKFDKLKLWHLYVMWAVVIASFLYFLLLYKNVMEPYSYSFEAMFSAFVHLPLNMYMLVFIVALYGFMNVLKEKREKADKEFNALRCEIIDKSKDLWKKEEEWKNRHLVYEMMKKTFDVNLYHENK
ncbi:YpbF family protein [Cytobacillus gottheilii]|uniref:YpbF family protein n=1 Tax=Cytobacillus gottheilii TaxID=859144 RepID=UPI00249598C7|nr:YpbF family protein [Cytobacillus gottheilii]